MKSSDKQKYFDGEERDIDFISNMREASAKTYINPSRIERDIDWACTQLDLSSGEEAINLQLLSPTEAKYALIVTDSYNRHVSLLDEENFVLTVNKIN